MRKKYASSSLLTLLLHFVVLLFNAGCSDTQKKAITYTFSHSWGEEGNAEGQLLHPIGIAIHEEMIYVSDAGNHRIQVFDKQGTYIRTFGEKGTELGQLNRPMHLAFGGDTLFVPEYLNDRIQLFTPAGNSLSTLGSSGTGGGGFDAPGGVSINKQSGHVLVADFYNHLVQAFDSDGLFVKQFGKGKYGSEPGVFTYPTDVAHLEKGKKNSDFIVADAYNNRIQRIAISGEVKWMIPDTTIEAGTMPGRFDVATAVATDKYRRTYVADFENHRIQVFDKDGVFITAFGQKGPGDGEFNHPTDMEVDQDGRLYVVDFGNNRIQVFTPEIGS